LSTAPGRVGRRASGAETGFEGTRVVLWNNRGIVDAELVENVHAEIRKVVWRMRVAIDDTTSGKGDAVLKTSLRKEPVNVVLMETGRLRRGSPVWEDEGVMVVVSLDGWRGSPPSQWTTRRMKIRHDQLGGVTEGEFTVYVAHTGGFAGFDWYERLQGVPARLGHVY
jgi:hypothetical protein